MLHPVGGLAPSVYWRRRILLLLALVLVIVSVYAIFFRSGGGNPPKSSAAFTGGVRSSTPAVTPSTSSVAPVTSSASKSPTPTPTPTPTPVDCVASQLRVVAATDKPSYPSAAKPTVSLIVTDKGPSPCIADLSDAQIELRIYTGGARVWGSHDCAIAPGTSLVTLPVNQQIRRNIEWSGLSSQPHCTGTRTRVPAGTYTLYAFLNGQEGSTTRFTMAG